MIIRRAKQIANSSVFENTILGLILFTAVIIGIEAFPQWMSPERQELFSVLHALILGAFIVEALIKLTAFAPRPWHYFKSGWNCFDFALIVVSLLPIASDVALLGRVLRLLRVLRLINALPELRLIVETLLRSIPSMLNIAILMGVLFFVYAVLGFHLFHQHDPEHWRDLGYAVLTLFRIVTLEDWTDVMYTAMEMSPFYAAYFVSFVVIGTFVVVNLFIAVVINNLEEAKLHNLEALEHPDTHQQLLDALKNAKTSMQTLERKLQSKEHAEGTISLTPHSENSIMEKP